MGADEALKLVEFADRLVFEKTGHHLKDIQQEVLQQVLEGKLLKQIHPETHENSYIQTNIAPGLWTLLTEVTGKEVKKKNVRQVLERLYKQHSSEATPPSPSFNYRSEQTWSIQLLGNTQWHEASETDNAESQTAEEQSANSTAEEFHPSSPRSHAGNPRSNFGRTIFGLPNFINFIKPGVPLLLSVGVLASLFALSWLANWYGVTNHLAGKLPKAQFFYFLAHKLNPASPATHYSQGVMYEDQQNYEKARAEYQLAIEGGLIEAYNNQARLYILQTKEYDAAVALLNKGLLLAKNDRVKADMYKNRGWARLEQGRYAEAKVDLQEAIKLKSDSPNSDSYPSGTPEANNSRAPAYCLLAQVLEREGDNKSAIPQWENCLGYSYQTNLPEEDSWFHLAQQRLNVQKSNQ